MTRLCRSKKIYSYIYASISLNSVISFVRNSEETGPVCVQSVLTVCFCSATLFDTEPVLHIKMAAVKYKVLPSPMSVLQHQNKLSYKQEHLKIKIFSPLVKALPWHYILEGHNNFNTLCSENLKRHVLIREIFRLQPTEMNFLQIRISNTDYHYLINN
jgi:hypothetical protein